MNRIFISHTHNDQPIADALSRLIERLFSNNVEVSYSTKKELNGGISPGEDWFHWIVEQVRASKAAFVLLTPSSIQKPWVLWEAGAVAGVEFATKPETDISGPPVNRVYPITFGLSSVDVPSPFARTQLVAGESEADMNKLVTKLLECFGDHLTHKQSIDIAFRSQSAVKDYVEHGIMEWQGTEEYKKLLDIVEPYSYRARLTMPKYMVNSAGDQFFVVDSSQFYWNDLKGQKYLRYVPNTDHVVTRRSDAGQSLASFYEAVVRDWKRPEFDWSISKDGVITVTSKDNPSAVKLWSATNPEARDFRLEQIGPAYKAQDLAPESANKWVVKLQKPEHGYSATFIELTYPTPGGTEWKFTTGIKVMPDVYPFPAPTPKLPKGATPRKK